MFNHIFAKYYSILVIYDLEKAHSDPGGCPKWTFKMDEYLKKYIIFIAFGVHLHPITAFYGLMTCSKKTKVSWT